MRAFTVQQRRRALVARHHLAGDAAGPHEVTRALIALHATDPASVYLSVLARSSTSTVADVAHAMYGTRSLVRWLAMRRTLFVFERDDVPLVHAAVGIRLAAMLRTQLVNRLERSGTDPPIEQDVSHWLDEVGDATVAALHRRGAATGAELSADVPRLRSRILPRAASDTAQNVTSSLLAWLGAEGRILRGDPTGAWTTRSHRWEPLDVRWPNGLPSLDEHDARRTLARRWLERFGPATIEDLQWWTGWTKTATRQALAELPVEEVDLHGRPGIVLPSTEDADDAPPVVALLPALDPTPMGWKHRDWFFDIDARQVFDRTGNIGPTVWWDGGIIGSWTVMPNGEIRAVLLADHGRAVADAVDFAAAALHPRLEGATITAAFRTPLEAQLKAGTAG